jgi:alkanesulfonate monooxygenase SsuD/methylene tetrahydromethanopterin reductase-like flavin-dependent oxidoreductase (luciferase family)
MKFGIVYPTYSEYVNKKLVENVARKAEENDFEYFFVSDHYMTSDTSVWFESWSLLSYLSAITTKIKLGTCVTPIPFRNPAQLAKIVANVDILSEGRVILGVGAGWSREEFEGYSKWEKASERVSMTEEGVRLILELWQKNEVNFEGKYYRFKRAILEPKPIQNPHPPLWFGAFGNRMLKITSKYGDGWIPGQIESDIYARLKNKIKTQKSNFCYAYELFIPYKTQKDYIDIIEKFKEKGCEHFTIKWLYEPQEMVERIKWFKENVISVFSK